MAWSGFFGSLGFSDELPAASVGQGVITLMSAYCGFSESEATSDWLVYTIITTQMLYEYV